MAPHKGWKQFLGLVSTEVVCICGRGSFLQRVGLLPPRRLPHVRIKVLEVGARHILELVVAREKALLVNINNAVFLSHRESPLWSLHLFWLQRVVSAVNFVGVGWAIVCHLHNVLVFASSERLLRPVTGYDGQTM